MNNQCSSLGSSWTGIGISVVIPCFNEDSEIVFQTVKSLKGELDYMGVKNEFIIVDDSSSTPLDILEYQKKISSSLRVIRNPINMGYGFSLKKGISVANYETICIIDADATYPVNCIKELLESYFKNGLHMVVGARTGDYYKQNILKSFGRKILQLISEFTTGRNIPDVNSGFRVFNKSYMLRYQEVISSGFSFTTTITILFMQEQLFVSYCPITYNKRVGRTKVKHFRDALRTLQLISNCLLFANPLKLFLITITLYTVAAAPTMLFIFLKMNSLAVGYCLWISTIFIIFSLSHLATQQSILRKIKG